MISTSSFSRKFVWANFGETCAQKKWTFSLKRKYNFLAQNEAIVVCNCSLTLYQLIGLPLLMDECTKVREILGNKCEDSPASWWRVVAFTKNSKLYWATCQPLRYRFWKLAAVLSSYSLHCTIVGAICLAECQVVKNVRKKIIVIVIVIILIYY